MSREIKFRAWDIQPHKSQMVYDWYSVWDSNPKPVMQYTGLKDKNGVEIYEGDICRMIYRDCEKGGWFTNRKEQGVIYFDKNWGVKFDCRDATQRCASHWDGTLTIADKPKDEKKQEHWSDFEMVKAYSHIEVIGNIHENPDLLTNN